MKSENIIIREKPQTEAIQNWKKGKTEKGTQLNKVDSCLHVEILVQFSMINGTP